MIEQVFPKSSDAVEFAAAFFMVSVGAVALATAIAIVVYVARDS